MYNYCTLNRSELPRYHNIFGYNVLLTTQDYGLDEYILLMKTPIVNIVMIHIY